MIKRLLDESKDLGILTDDTNTAAATEIVFNGMLGASVNYGVDKSVERLGQSIGSLIDYLENLKQEKKQ